MREDLHRIKTEIQKGFNANLPGYHLARRLGSYLLELVELLDLQDQEIEALKARVTELEQ